MTAFERVRFADLPPELRSRLVEADFLMARLALDPDHIIVWALDRPSKNSREFEWSRARGDFLSDSERADAAGAPRALPLPERGLRATLAYSISASTQHLEEQLTIVDATTGAELVRASQDVYSPVRFDAVEFAQQELTQARFPNVYAGWKDKAKVDYWMRVLYRQRRWNGEGGHDEDAVLAPRMVDDMRRIDPHIERLLPAIAKALAQMEGGNAAEMLRKLQSAR